MTATNTSQFIEKPMFLVAHDGHVFACKHEDGTVLLTNEHGCQTRMTWYHALYLLGLFKSIHVGG